MLYGQPETNIRKITLHKRNTNKTEDKLEFSLHEVQKNPELTSEVPGQVVVLGGRE